MEREAIEAHPIREMIGGLMENGKIGEEPIVLRSEARREIERAVDEYAKACTPELMFVAQTMYSIADWLEAQNAPKAAEVLCAVLDRTNVLTAMQVINERARNELGALEIGTPGDDFASFASKETGRRAPEVNEAAPDNAVKAGSLGYPKRL